MIFKFILAFTVAFVVSAAFGSLFVPYLRKIKAGQMIREEGPKWHQSKAGTPTMGGIIFILGVAAACLTTGFDQILQGNYAHILVLVFALIYGAVGFLDDYEKLKKKQNLGLTAKQ